jgi:hypothetical protein
MRKEKEKTNEADKLKENELYDLLELALLENKYQFVNLLLECEIDLGKFLTVERLKNLYNYEAVRIEVLVLKEILFLCDFFSQKVAR